MKRILAAVLAFLMLLAGTALAEQADYSQMTDEELRTIISEARMELARRGFVLQENLLIYESEEIELYLTGEYEFSPDPDYKYLSFGVNVLNKRSGMLDMAIRNAVVNGCSVDGSGVYDIAGQSQKSDKISFWLDDTDFEQMADFEEVRFELNIYDTETYDTIRQSKPIEIHLNVGQIAVSRPESMAQAEATAVPSAGDGTQRIESVSGLFSMDVPDSYISVNADLVKLLYYTMDEEAAQEYFGQSGVDAEQMLELLDGIAAEEFEGFDYVLADDMVSNINARVTENFGVSPQMLGFMADMLSDTIIDNYVSMGIPQEEIHALGVETHGSTDFMGIMIENVGEQKVCQYMTVNEEKAMIMLTFTGIPDEVVKAVLSSVILH